jgi:hypothetical protein
MTPSLFEAYCDAAWRMSANGHSKPTKRQHGPRSDWCRRALDAPREGNIWLEDDRETVYTQQWTAMNNTIYFSLQVTKKSMQTISHFQRNYDNYCQADALGSQADAPK